MNFKANFKASGKALKKGDIVDIISPATACTKDEIKKIKNFVEKIGLIPRIFLEKELTLGKSTSHEFPSFDAKTRFKQLKDAIENQESKIIWCIRGGYGSADLLSLLQKMEKPASQKIFIGFSDIVSITSFLQKEWGWQIICAPMLGQIVLESVSKKSEEAIVDLIFGRVKKLEYDIIALTPNDSNTSLSSSRKQGSIRSCNQFIDPRFREDDKRKNEEEEGNTVITGGCISVLAGHFGTKNQVDWQDKILFLEDEGEDGERLERYFNQIITIITEQEKYPKAILLGNFLESNPHGTPKAKNINMAIEKLVRKIEEKNLNIPILSEKSNCLGHSKNMLPLILGSEVRMTNNLLTLNISHK